MFLAVYQAYHVRELPAPGKLLAHGGQGVQRGLPWARQGQGTGSSVRCCSSLCIYSNRQLNAFCCYLQLGVSVPYAEWVLAATQERQAVAVYKTLHLLHRLYPLIVQSNSSLPNHRGSQCSREVQRLGVNNVRVIVGEAWLVCWGWEAR